LLDCILGELRQESLLSRRLDARGIVCRQAVYNQRRRIRRTKEQEVLEASSPGYIDGAIERFEQEVVEYGAAAVMDEEEWCLLRAGRARVYQDGIGVGHHYGECGGSKDGWFQENSLDRRGGERAEL
jgi:hypothetical protein